jgi:D-beta-D-heptose 7-phosphate kinase/D-beta-D-heptose 1-phosphate adenosyltransferase
VVANLAAFEIKTCLVSQIGQDTAGRRIREILQQLTCPVDNLVTTSVQPSTIQSRFISANQQLLRTDFEETSIPDEQTAAAIIAQVTDEIENYDAMVLSDSGKGVLSDDICAALISLARAADIPVIINPHGKKYSKYAGATVIAPTLQALSEASDITAHDEDSISAAATNIIVGCDIETVLALRGQDGLSVITENKDPLHLSGKQLDMYDAAGVSDTITALMAAGLGSGATIEQAASLANSAGSIMASKQGTAVVEPDELKPETE